MKDGIGNFLYIILLIVFGIISAINQNNKKKEAERKRRMSDQDVRPQAPRPKTPFQNMLETLREEFAEDEVHTEIPEEKSEIKKEDYSVKSEFLKSRTDNEEYKERENKRLIAEKEKKEKKEKLEEAYKLMNKMDTEEEAEEDITGNHFLNTRGDLKKAVILSEILNRKY